MYPLKQIIAIILSIFRIITPFIAHLITDAGEKLQYEWTSDTEFEKCHYIEIKKDPDADFKILNLTDVQIYDNELYTSGGIGCDSFTLVSRLIEDEQPDLITITGDSFCSTLSTLALVDLLDSYEIPWAPVMGNHDGGIANDWPFFTAWHLLRAKYSLFELGPKGMGYGNYIVNITENGDVIHTLYFMDTHNERVEYTVGKKTILGYGHLWKNQIEWYEWAVRGNEKLAGHPIQSTVLFHIPIYEYNEAWNSVSTGKKTKLEPFAHIDPKYSDIAFGRHFDAVSGPRVKTDFFDKVKELGSTKDIICGHDHRNDFSIVYQGVRLSYALHTGFGSYYRDDMMGGTVYTIHSDGESDFQHVYYTFSDGEWIAQ